MSFESHVLILKKVSLYKIENKYFLKTKFRKMFVMESYIFVTS